jgi:hypothetical protein
MLLEELKELLGDKPLIMYREFSYEWLFANMVTEKIKFVIRLKIGNNPTVLNENGDKVSLRACLKSLFMVQLVEY